MPISICPYRRFPVQCSVTYNAGPFHGQEGIAWNLSLNGLRLSGDLPMRQGKLLSLTVTLPNEQKSEVSEAVVQWSRGSDFAAETRLSEPHTQAHLQHDVKQLVQSLLQQNIEDKALILSHRTTA